MSTYQKRLIEAMGTEFTVKELCNVTGMSYAGVKKVIRGDSLYFSTVHNVQVAKLLGVSSDWLAIGQGPRHRLDRRASDK